MRKIYFKITFFTILFNPELITTIYLVHFNCWFIWILLLNFDSHFITNCTQETTNRKNKPLWYFLNILDVIVATFIAFSHASHLSCIVISTITISINNEVISNSIRIYKFLNSLIDIWLIILTIWKKEKTCNRILFFTILNHP